MSTKFDDFLQEQLRDPEFRKEYEAFQSERKVFQTVIDAGKKSEPYPETETVYKEGEPLRR